MDLEFRQLKYFIAVAEEGNIGRAAQRLNISQPPISRQIQALEHELGAALFIRTPKGVDLTEAGRVFYADAQKVLSQAKNAVDRTRAAERGELGRLDIAFFGSTVYQTVPLLLRAFHRAQPQIEVSLTRMGKADQVNALRDGRIHIGFGRYYNQASGLAIELISREPLYAAIPADLALGTQDEVRLADLAHLPVVLFPAGDRPSFADEIISLFRGAKVEFEVDSIATDSTAALALVASGTRCTIVPEAIAKLQFPALNCVPIKDCRTLAPSSCIYLEDDQRPVLKEFLKVLRSVSLSAAANAEGASPGGFKGIGA
ncbi:LysR family transcriptional regulator [Tabrizicola piscis]|jgi:LysR family transcriptional regulator, benzoate and cis,cis-muconate-responsive activator of ben and cat genes|uniref:LysR family transcriptional regulator n=1 Tax=Tabrizicola piscis TaxID=2494374 RepID=A0A3S8U8Z9_9RHOB|nr:LysR family transcriptional regulator [Tabrizicola piscis]AZL60047.1 LysR family transcriptional regulator [Tabrizicola piscis]